MVSLYFHIPFCKRKCDYCHFFVIPEKEIFKDQLLEGILLELKARRSDLAEKEICSIYFGGGTPYLFGAKAFEKILEAVPGAFSDRVEITLEANPDDMTLEGLQRYRSLGINRLSIGVQSLDDQLLKVLSRRHDSKRAKEAVFTAQQAGFDNLSIDLMYDVPHQTLRKWQSTLDEACLLPITHLSLYNLTIEPHTVFFKKRSQLRLALPRPEVNEQMYRTAIATMEDNRFRQYEISAFERCGLPSLHNSGYWTGRPFLGFGPSAFSYWNGKRFRNVCHLGRYLRFLKEGSMPVDFSEELAEQAKLRELLVIHLRLLEGVELKKFNNISDETRAGIQKYVESGLLLVSGDRLQLTRKGMFLYDTVASDLI